MNAHDVTRTWPVADPCFLEPITNGINSKIWRVGSPSGSYILRQYRPSADLPRVRYELEVLRQLAGMGLSFAVAVPLPTRDGDLLATQDGAVLTLVPLIAGATPDRQSAADATVAGEAIGELAQALSRVRIAVKPATVKTYGEIDSIHPAVPDPVGALPALPLPPDRQERMARLLEGLAHEVPAAYASLPMQQVHGDVVYANLLMEAGRITGVLDFEFTCRDLRSMDLASALSGWALPGAKGLAPGQEWALIEAFGKGYCRRQPLTAAEIGALPLLMRLRRAAVYANLTGLYLSGGAPVETMSYAVESALQGEDWLAAHGAELQRRARRWGR